MSIPDLVSLFSEILLYNFSRGDQEPIETSRDIGVVIQCLDECKRRGDDCMAITLLNERGGRQRCFALSASAGVDNVDPTPETGVTYYEKICTRKLMQSKQKHPCFIQPFRQFNTIIGTVRLTSKISEGEVEEAPSNRN